MVSQRCLKVIWKRPIITLVGQKDYTLVLVTFAVTFLLGFLCLLFFVFVRKYKKKIQMDIIRQEMDLDRIWGLPLKENLILIN